MIYALPSLCDSYLPLTPPARGEQKELPDRHWLETVYRSPRSGALRCVIDKDRLVL